MRTHSSLSLLRGALALGVLVSPAGLALGLTVPFENWETRPDGVWTGGGGACLLRENASAQVFPALLTPTDATQFAARLQKALFDKKLRSVVTQVVERPDQWAVLASYQLEDRGETYKVTQLYLSSGGRLRTVTGSARQAEFDQCVNDMAAFVKNLAN